MTGKHRYHGGLQFNGDADSALARFSDIVAATLQDYGHLVERKSTLSDSEASIVSSQYLVRLTLETRDDGESDRYERMDRSAGLKTLMRSTPSRPRNRLTLTIAPVSDLLDDTEISEMMLVVILYRMIDICSTQRIEWLSPNTVLTVDQFLSAFDAFTPRNPRDRRNMFDSVSGQFADVDLPEPAYDVVASTPPRPIKLTDDQLLSIAFRQDAEPPVEPERSEPQPEDSDRPSDILRLTSWGMTGCIASVSAPVAISLAAVNLIRGEDFRLNTQVLSLTMAIVSASSTQAFAGFASAIGM